MSVCWWEQYHDTAISGRDSSDLRNRDNTGCVCVAQYHDTVVYKILRREIHKKPFKVDLRIHGVPQDAVLDDRERMSKNSRNG